MKTLTEKGLTAAALARLAKTPNPRMKRIMTALIRHLHGFVREVGITPVEWKTGIEFLTAVGHLTDGKRQEFILLSDTLGVSAMVDLVRHRRLGHGTDSSLLGPFYRDGAPEQPLGASIAGNTPGETIVLRGQVTDAHGRPLSDALLDVWQAAPNGKYDIQDEHQVGMNLRGRLRTGPDGRYEFRSVKPKSYPVPDDGPVGALLRAQGRHPYRPAADAYCALRVGASQGALRAMHDVRRSGAGGRVDSRARLTSEGQPSFPRQEAFSAAR
jgi:hydroxyquinol 1,2-dioxygenase